jgi:hypothetical protein
VKAPAAEVGRLNRKPRKFAVGYYKKVVESGFRPEKSGRCRNSGLSVQGPMSRANNEVRQKNMDEGPAVIHFGSLDKLGKTYVR